MISGQTSRIGLRAGIIALLLISSKAAPRLNQDSTEGGRLAESPKGTWGHISPISEGKHPNLYYDQSEIEELRQMMLVQHSPKHLYERYNAEIRDCVAVKTIPDQKAPHAANMKASLSYAIKPSAEKADAIRASLLSFMSAFPRGLPAWYDT